jgi:predicted dehydrogenase
MENLRVALIGAGSMARQHLQVLQSLPDVQVVAISSRGIERLEKLAEDFGIPQRFRKNEEMLETVKPDAAVVAVSAANVYAVALSCIQSGTPTLLEKPPGLTSAETEGLLKTSMDSGRQHMVGLNRRFYSVIQNAKTLVEESGGLVSVLVQAPEDMAPVRALNLHPPEVLTHWMVANGIHCIDLLRFFGGGAKSVHALSSAWEDTERNSFGALIRFESGAIGHYVSNWISPGRWQVSLHGFDMRIDLCPLEKGVLIPRKGPTSEIPIDEMDIRFKPGFFRQDQYFLDHVRQNSPIERPAANLQDAYDTMKLVEAIAQSNVG